MSREEKLLKRIESIPSDLTWSELSRFLSSLGYSEKKGSGSRRKFVGEGLPLISLHEPHNPKIVKKKYILDIVELLKREELI
ncbi:MAG: hexulose-6-phosphate synthase [Nioella sp.]|nr:hexulose-6-phosphate synthase [Nioella sp.]